MVDKKISELSSNGTLDGTESTVLVQSGSNVSNVKVLLSAIRSYIVNGYLTTATAASTYQTTSGMSSYLTTSTAASTYQSIANSRYQFLNDSTTTLTTYTVPASAVTENGRTIIELSNNSLTSITVNAATGTGKVAGDSVHISITGTYAAQVLDASGVTLQGDLTFSYQYETKTLVYKGTNTWKIVG